MNTQHIRPLWRGAAYAAVVAPFALVMMFMITLFDPPLSAFFQLLVGATPVTTFAIVLFGLPGAWALRGLGLLDWTTVCLGGGLIGFGIAALASGMLVSDYTPRAWAWWLLGTLTGLASGVAFASGIRPLRVWGRGTPVASD